MIGPILNALGILLGALFGLARRNPLSARSQNSAKSALGALTALCGLHLAWLHLGGGAFSVIKQLFIALLAMILGNLLGKLLGLQKLSNRVGRHASGLLAGAANQSGQKPKDGFLAATLLFCAAPLGFIGAVTDGLNGYFFPLALKALMDGLAMTRFIKMFRWPVALAALPVFLLLNSVAAGVRAFALPLLAAPALLNSVGTTAGLIICAMTLVILEVRRVELADYLPALLFAPLLTRLLF